MAKTILAFAILMVIAAVVFEIRAFNAGRRRITRGQLRLRILAASLLLLVLIMALVADYILPGRGTSFEQLNRRDKAVVICYWLFCLAIAFFLIVLALADVRQCIIYYAIHRKEITLDSKSNLEHRN